MTTQRLEDEFDGDLDLLFDAYDAALLRAQSAIRGLTIYTKRDGTWLEFTANGKHGAVRLETLAERMPGIIGAAIRSWCRQRQEFYGAPADRKPQQGGE